MASSSSSTYESLVEVCVSSAMNSIKHFTNAQLQELVQEDETLLNNMVDNLSQVRTLPAEREMGLTQNKSQAEWNLSLEPKLNQAKTQLAASYDRAVQLKQDVHQLKATIDSLSQQRSLDTTCALLQAAAQEAEDDSEALGERYLNGEMNTDKFLKEFLEKKTLAHTRKVKAEKLVEILKNQYFPSSSSSSTNNTNTPYPMATQTGSSSLYPMPSRPSFR